MTLMQRFSTNIEITSPFSNDELQLAGDCRYELQESLTPRTVHNNLGNDPIRQDL